MCVVDAFLMMLSGYYCPDNGWYLKLVLSAPCDVILMDRDSHALIVADSPALIVGSVYSGLAHE